MPQLFHPKIEPGYPDNCITVEDAVNAIRTVFGGPTIRVERLKFECITEKGGTLKVTWDREDVGQLRRRDARFSVRTELTEDRTLDSAVEKLTSG